MTGPKGYARQDDYAWARCLCKHLVYADQKPGDPCRFCDCTEHAAAREAS